MSVFKPLRIKNFLIPCLIFVTGFVFSISPLSAQSVQMSGSVKDETGEALPGATIVVKGTSNGTVANADGDYSLTADSGSTLIVSFSGYNQQEVSALPGENINITLTPEQNSLNEVVVVGYGAVKRKDITGSIGIVDAREAKKLSTNDLSQMLQGRVPGVIVNSDGQPGAGPVVRIRGFSTFGDNAPLYVIDGVPMSNSVRDFNPNDIESMQVLKDASAGAIYGSRAANGVIIITTRHGRKSTPFRLDYSTYIGVDKIWQRIPVLNRTQYQTIMNEMQTNANLPLIAGNDPASPLFVGNVDTDWQKEAQKNGSRQNHFINLSGGSENITYNVSLDYFGNKGTMVGNGPTYDRYTTRVNTTGEKGIFKFGQSFFYAHSKENILTYRSDILTGTRPPLIVDMVHAVPTHSVYDPTNVGGFGGTEANIQNVISLNVIGVNTMFKNYTNVDRTLANAFGEVQLINTGGHSLQFRIRGSYDRTFANDFSFQPPFDLGFFFRQNISRLDQSERLFTTGIVENTLTYNKAFSKHFVDVLLGQSFQQDNFEILSGHSENVVEPYLVLDNGNNKTTSGNRSAATLASYFGRVNYNFDSRYLFTATLRRDGSSRFAPSSRFGYFPSAAVGWRISNEGFFAGAKGIVSDLKFRASYGQLGNQNIGNYLYSSYINPNIVYNFNNTKVFGGLATNLVSEDIKWETRTTTNIGLDAVFLNGIFDLSAEYYDSKSSDVLVGVPVPASTGSINQAPLINAATLRNSGFEGAVAYHKLKGDFTFDISANIATIKNRVLALGGNNEPIYGVGSKTEVGSEVGQHFGFVADGIFQSVEEINNHATQFPGTAPGDYRFKDLNGDGIVNADDRTYLGSGIPKLNYGFNFSAGFKNFDLSVFMQGSSGFLINSLMYRQLMRTTDLINRHTDILDRWTPTNTDTDIPRMVAFDPNDNQRDSDRPGWLQNGRYLRINTVSFGYTFKKGLVKGMSSLRLYTTAQNLYSFQSYKGFNPDFTSAINAVNPGGLPGPTGVFNPGFDGGSFPKPRILMVGLQVGF